MWLYLDEENTSRAGELIADWSCFSTVGFQQGWHCRGLAVSERAMLLVTGTQVWRSADPPQLSQYSEAARNGLRHLWPH